ncbi:hypothetical protein NQ318_022024 [Aromia moschata]|nr:hypothetical protein NQ318_022024 [Aromia moschata]
MVPVYH